MIRYQITSGRYLQNPDQWMQSLSEDADFIQIREPDLPTRILADLTRRVVMRVRAKVLVNDRIDVAIATGAAGVHLKSRSIAPGRVKALRAMIVTVACHAPVDFVGIEDADFAVLAPIFPPRSKDTQRTPLGIDGLRRYVESSPVPVLALGGITAENAAACLQAGAAGIAAITLFEKNGPDAF